MNNDTIAIIAYLIITGCFFVFALWDESKPNGKVKTDGDLLIIMVTCWPIWIPILIAGLIAHYLSKGIELLISTITKIRLSRQGDKK